MFISLPSRCEPSVRQSIRSPLTPPSVTPPSVSVTGSSTMQCERDRCKSPTTKAHTLLAKVATVVATSPQPTQPQPTAPRMAASISNSSSASNSPLSTPPSEGGHFPFGMISKELPESPDGGYISFPVFEEWDYKSDDERDGGSPPPRKR
ncbi:hypothetical protein DFP73DRAFT_591772 [Morchella snyderi]|nr:hypothetical protein DFP73DRAFT_591772 [Morchella snyderi]